MLLCQNADNSGNVANTTDRKACFFFAGEALTFPRVKLNSSFCLKVALANFSDEIEKRQSRTNAGKKEKEKKQRLREVYFSSVTFMRGIHQHVCDKRD